MGCHFGRLSAREQRPPFRRLVPCAGRQRAEHPALNAAQQQGFEALRQGMAPSANQQAALHSLWEKAPGYVPAHRGGWGEFSAAPAAAGAAQDAGEAAQRRAFLKWTQGEAMTAQEKALVDGLWNTDPHRASEYWAAGEFLDTEVPTFSALDGGGFDGTMEKRKIISVPLENGPYIKNGKPRGRPKLSGERLLDFEQGVYQNSLSSNGKIYDPNLHIEINWKPGQPRRGIVDFGHKPGKKYSDMFRKYKYGEISLEELKEFQFSPNNYQLETIHGNRSHLYE